ncbi:Spy/CpxP family protein refolding chaperone [Curvibacter sp. CHRR-16]|uniref:Spy/CpxP family protein refolding chaperone n=1 Tax=Curvibacter sp. CHRR-16 TaxID=2835872 RepID=UPI001BDACDB1|nr:Spy/CpxP family protein refolding chaperone [Curvibacter sp. CHRR-16]MBT0571022.1 Spy/CpxP family protein refolding chaperone [Curvibacter sp. CHRR-16]
MGIKHLTIALLGAAALQYSWAATEPQAAPQARHEAPWVKMESHLNLNDQQKQAFAEMLQTMRQHSRPDRVALEKMTTPERMAKMHAAMAEHAQKQQAAVEKFYSLLDEPQKKAFDQASWRIFSRHHDRMEHKRPAEPSHS